MFRGDFPVSRHVAGGFGDIARTGPTASGPTYKVGKGGRTGCHSCSVGSVKHVCLGIDRLEFIAGVEGAVVCVADTVCGVGPHGQFFDVSGAALDHDDTGPMAMALDGAAARRRTVIVVGLYSKRPAEPPKLPGEHKSVPIYRDAF